MDKIVTKKCTKCNTDKVLDDFHKDKQKRDGRACQCRDCRNIAHEEWRTNNYELAIQRQRASYHKNKDKDKDRRRRYYRDNIENIQSYWKDHYEKNKKKVILRVLAYQKNNKEKVNAKNKKWIAEHPERAREITRKKYINGKDKFKARNKSWRERNPNKIHVYKINRRVRESQGKITEREWLGLLKKYCYKCLCCGRSDVKLTADHVIPLARGGNHSISNIQPLCRSCNSSKALKSTDYRGN